MSGVVLVTGATGFIGRAVARRLAERGDALRLLVRDPDRAASLGLSRSAMVPGSLGDGESLRSAIRGVDGVIHLAGLTRAGHRREFDEVNRIGTRRLIDAIVANAPGARTVLVSSLAAAGPSLDGRGTDAPPDACRPVSDYGRSKLGGERELVTAAREREWIVIRPPIVYGPHDDGTRLLFRQALAPVVAVPWRTRPLSLIHVADLVAALVAALDRRDVRSVFLPVEGPDRLDTDLLVRRVAETCGRRTRTIRVPMLLPRLVAPMVEIVARLRRRPGFFNADKMREASAPGWVCDPEPARRALGFRAEITTAEGFRRVMEEDPVLARSGRAAAR